VTGNVNGFLLHWLGHVLTPLPALNEVMTDREFPMVGKGTLRDVVRRYNTTVTPENPQILMVVRA